MPHSGIDLHLFWAKTTHDPQQYPRAFHPLLCHMIDSSVVTRQMWRSALPTAARRHIAQALGLDEQVAKTCVAWLSGLHDAGKASPPFALRELRDKSEHLRKLYENTPFSHARNCAQVVPAGDAPHGIVTAYTLPALLKELGAPTSLAQQIAVIIGGHHGVVPRSEDTQRVRRALHEEREEWQQARRALVRELADLLQLPGEVLASCNNTLGNAAAMWLAGLVSVADWIASNQVYFPCRIEDAANCQPIDFVDYLKWAEQRAQEALVKLGWAVSTGCREPRAFEELFPNLKGKMRPLQEAVVRLADRLTKPGLVIIEAPMGEGKTEAAMYLADAWSAQHLAARGCYFALPTQATSNQMFGRVRYFLAQRYEREVINLQLLHGHAALSAEFSLLRRKADELLDSLKVTQVYDDDARRAESHRQNEDRASVIAAEWFTYRKRGLLAPFGVGTVDQALLSVLQTKHVFVRLFALAHKTIIIDEVHAYDAYMSALLERLLEWLAALGSPVVLLSATLPQARSRALLKAYMSGLSADDEVSSAATTGADALNARYPRITWVTSSETGAETISTSAQNSRSLRLAWLDSLDASPAGGPNKLGARLHEALSEGGCAAVICNTVKRAQEVFLSLEQYFASVPDAERPDLDLLHARFLYHERAARERHTLRAFGKPGAEIEDEDGRKLEVRRPARAILVATQIIEQSLDIDFDLMISELAPVDLLLQRAGRLHRHARSEPRPDKLHQPSLWLLNPQLDAHGLPNFGPSAFVYAPHILLRTWLELRHLRQQQTISIPDEVEELIEAVYGTRVCPAQLTEELHPLWEESKSAMEATRSEEASEAEGRWIKRPNYNGKIWRIASEPRAEDAPELHTAHQALTRLVEPTVQVICIYGSEVRPYLDLEQKEATEVSKAPSLAQAKRLLMHSMAVGNKEVVFTLLATEAPRGWRESPLLRNHRLIVLDENSSANIGAYRFHLHPKLGLRIFGKEREAIDA